MMLGSKDALRIVPYFVLPQFYPIFAYFFATFSAYDHLVKSRIRFL